MLLSLEIYMPFEALQQLEECYHSASPAVEKSEEAFACFTGIPDPFLNPVMHLRCPENLENKVDTLIKMAPPGTPLSFWDHPHNQAPGLVLLLKKRGFAPLFTCPFMAWSVKPTAPTEKSIQVANMDLFYEILSTGMQFNEIVKKEYRKFFDKTPTENYILNLGNQPASVGSLFLSGENGCIFNIATLPEHQKKGCFKSMMKFLMHRAHALGMHRLVLVGAPDSSKLYSDLGFSKLFDIDIYARGNALVL